MQKFKTFFFILAMTCGENMEYNHYVSGCQTNCVNKDDGNKTCDFPFTEGCVCKEGYVLGGTVCVKKDECGCESPVGYIAVSVLFSV